MVNVNQANHELRVAFQVHANQRNGEVTQMKCANERD